MPPPTPECDASRIKAPSPNVDRVAYGPGEPSVGHSSGIGDRSVSHKSPSARGDRGLGKANRLVVGKWPLCGIDLVLASGGAIALVPKLSDSPRRLHGDNNGVWIADYAIDP